ncbi:hypothetical protein [Proteus hauseri]|uniref:hypothetical protein n=1 Tax=Proteus hauseri TaxID=183417 RepID=UPI0032DB53D6
MLFTKLAYQWKQKRRARLSFLGAEIYWSVLLSIIQALVYQGYVKLYPKEMDLVFQSTFYYQFSFSTFGLMEIIFFVIQIYIFTLILSQRIRDIGISYPVVIAFIFTAGSLLLMPYTLIYSPNIMMVLSFIVLIGYLIALFAPSAHKVDINTDEDKNKIVN